MDVRWSGINDLDSRDFQCGYCGNVIATNKGYFANSLLHGYAARIYICPHCAKPTFFHGETQQPEVAPGNEVNHVPEDVYALYKEARNCVAVSAYTASVLICRKLLMNLAVSQGAGENLKFIEYVDYLANNGFVPPNGRGWVDHIRKKGNEATHEIQVMIHDDATELISFSEMLLKFIYEFPAQVPPAPSA
jgi:hypothetical protein